MDSDTELKFRGKIENRTLEEPYVLVGYNIY